MLPGNVDGPDSPHHGRAGWTWYTGSAAWLHRVVTQWVLGVRPEWDGLCIDPCLPADWERVRMMRPYRAATLTVAITRVRRAGTSAETRITLNGKHIAGHVIAAERLGPGAHDIAGRIG